MSEPGNGDATGGGRSGISRRRLLTAGAMLFGASAATASSTGALFRDAESASGTVQIDDDPTLERLILDNSTSSPDKVSYDVQYKVSWMEDFDHVEIDVRNDTDGSYPQANYSLSTKIDSVEYRPDGSTDKGAFGDTYRFDFRVYDTAGNVVIQETVYDDADGDDTGDDMGTVDDPNLESFTVYDRHHAKADYLVEYELSNTARFQEVRVYFENQDSDKASDDGVRTSTDEPTGSVEFEKGGTGGDTYEITVRVLNTDGIVVDSGRVTDTAGDETNSSWSS